MWSNPNVISYGKLVTPGGLRSADGRGYRELVVDLNKIVDPIRKISCPEYFSCYPTYL